MAQTYGVVNLLSSFGFSHCWRKSCVEALAVRPEHHCADLMSGMGESSVLLSNSGAWRITAVDFCPAMTARAAGVKRRRRMEGMVVETKDVLLLEPDGSFDRICVAFGLKTLSRTHAVDADLRAGRVD